MKVRIVEDGVEIRHGEAVMVYPGGTEPRSAAPPLKVWYDGLTWCVYVVTDDEDEALPEPSPEPSPTPSKEASDG